MPNPTLKPYLYQVWRVNVRTWTLVLEPVPSSWERLGGRGLLARILLDEVPGSY